MYFTVFLDSHQHCEPPSHAVPVLPSGKEPSQEDPHLFHRTLHSRGIPEMVS